MALPVRTLILSDTADRELENNLWTDRYIAASMKYNGNTEQVKVRYRGGHTREYPKRSYEVVRNGESVHYNAEYDDPSMIRNALSFAFFPQLGVHAPACRHVLLFRNGIPLGVYLEIEGVGIPFFKRRNTAARSLFYAVNNHADFGLRVPETDRMKSSLLSGYEYRFGGAEERKNFRSFIRSINEAEGRRFADLLDRQLDVENYLRWTAGAVLTGNYDGFEQNYAVYRHRRSGKYRIIPWDYEGTWGRNCYGQIQDDDLVPVHGCNRLTDKIMEHRPYLLRYRNILRSALRGPFSENRLIPMADRLIAGIAPYIREDYMHKWSYREFLGESHVIRRYIRVRRGIVARELEGKAVERAFA